MTRFKRRVDTLVKFGKRDPLPGRRCFICHEPGGLGSRTALRFLGYKIPDGEMAYAHGPCLINARKRKEEKQA